MRLGVTREAGGACEVRRLFRRAANEAVIDRLYRAIVTAARHPELFLALRVPDSFEGRFESLALHAVLVLRHLQGAASPGPDMAQDLVDTVFRHFDRTLREMGVGDVTVPKRMKTMAEAFLGRSAAYDAALRATQGPGEDALAAALSRNVYSGRDDGVALARYAAAGAAALEQAPLQSLVDGVVPFPDPARFAGPRGTTTEASV